ncbi:lysophosphatidic acid receptor 5 [Mixophyes fleayi]|uniref:lysophosphatidic acid receptor 5 n=1 Tax=Mixophyes fleayi TaxID=3061075 RepID=UPI003F4E21BB
MTTVTAVSHVVLNGSGMDICDEHTPPKSRTLLLVGYSLLMPLGVILNGVSLLVFLRWLRPLTVVSTFLCNLALSDLLFSLSLPLRIYFYANGHWPFGSFLCRLSGSIFHINMYGSCLFLFCINVDRYLAIVHPLRFRHLRRRKVARLTCLCVWLVIVGGSVPAALVHNSKDCWNGHEPVPRCFEGLSNWNSYVFPLLLVAEVIGFLLPLGAVLYGSCHVFWELCRAAEGGAKRRKKTIRLLIINLSIFLFCFVPYNSTLVGYGLLRAELIEDHFEAKSTLKRIISITVLLASTNCALDPLVYYFSTEGFRNTLTQLGSSKRPGQKNKTTKNTGGIVASNEDSEVKYFGITTTSSMNNESDEKPQTSSLIRIVDINGKTRRKIIEESEI